MKKELGFTDYIIKPTLLCTLFFMLYWFANSISHSIFIAGSSIKIYDLTLPLISAFLLLYNQKALPVLGVFLLFSICTLPLPQLLIIISQLISAFISNKLYLRITGKRGVASFGRSKLTPNRICWLVFFNALLFMFLNQWLQLKLYVISESSLNIFTMQNLIQMQWLIISCLTGIPFCHLLLRSCYKPVWFINYIRRVKISLSLGPSIIYQMIWILLLIFVMSCLVLAKNNLLIFTDYSLLWLLPLMLWGSIYIGHSMISPIWVFILIVLGEYVDNYIPIKSTIDFLNYEARQVEFSSMMFIFSFTIVFVGVMSIRIHSYISHLKRMGLSEPNTGLPNLQLLKRDLLKYEKSGLCIIQHPELNSLTQIYGLRFQFEFIKSLVNYFLPFLHEDEGVYFSPGCGILLRLNNYDSHYINMIYDALFLFRFSWDKMSFGLNFGFSCMICDSPIKDINFTVGKLNAGTFISLQRGRPEILDTPPPGDNIVSTLAIRHILQRAIDKQAFVLVAQPIISTKNKRHYHEILIRMKTENDKLCFPDTFLPIAQEAGLLAEVDITVIEQTFRFMRSLDTSMANSHFSINLTPASLNRNGFVEKLHILFAKYLIKPERIIFEIIESDIIDDSRASKSLQELRCLGCKIAIDDFGTGSSSYSRLKKIEADILKIDGSFVRNILTDEFDYLTVKSFCESARLKKMEVVAEFVENEDIKQVLTSMGVDWLQGYHTGKPVPVESLSANRIV